MLQFSLLLVAAILGSTFSLQSITWHRELTSSRCHRSSRLLANAAEIQVKPDHTILKIPPVRALMLTTAWKNEAENLRALGYTTKDTTHTIVQKSSAADLLSTMQRWSNQLAVLSKQADPTLLEDHPLKDVLTGMNLLCAMSMKKGTALVFYKTALEENGGTGVVNIEACVGNIALGTNEIAEEALVRHIIEEAKKGALSADIAAAEVKALTVKARVAPSGSTYLPPFYADLGFTPVVDDGIEEDEGPLPEVVIGWGGAEKTGREKMGWGGMWTEADGDEKLVFRLSL
mmetsp:Transcript_29253/g.59837  ORF Transcript_29253/g.59837 Transcript_29253/m.59837 type:complete len:288 (-) Transcript_29253:102-965(-)